MTTTNSNLNAFMACLAATLLAGCGGGGGTSSVHGSTVSVAVPGPSPAPPAVPPPITDPATPVVVIAPPSGVGLARYTAAAAGVVPDLNGGSLLVTPDGNAWFSGNLAPNTIGRMSATGAVSFPVTGAAVASGVNAGPLALGADGKLWFCDFSGGSELRGAILSIDPATGVSVKYQPTGPTPPATLAVPMPVTPPNGITAGAQAYAIAASADGKLWFSEYGAKRIGLFDPVLNTAIEYGPLQSRATLLTTGPDGWVWFAENLSESSAILGRIAIVSRVALDGSTVREVRITEFSAQPISGNITAITTGPDGQLWFVRNGLGGAAIGKFDPATLAVTLYGDLLGNFSQLGAIVAGPDAKLWFSDYYNGYVGSITTAGVISEFSSGATGPQFNTMAAGRATDAAHRVWFTLPGDGKIGQITLP